MEIHKSSDVNVILKKDALPSLRFMSLQNGKAIDGEVFTCQFAEPQWFGFYDWLRKSDGTVIGIFLRPDQGAIDVSTMRDLAALGVVNETDGLRILFSRDQEFDPTRSDDADFGGNFLFRGDLGSIAITFNAPVQR